MAEFRVVIEGLELDAKATQALNDSIQKAVLSHLADHDITSKGKAQGLVAFRPHPDWYGLVAQLIAQGELRNLPAVDRTFQQFER